MGRRLLLDTGVLIGLERGSLSPSVLAADDDLCLPMIVVAECELGVALADPQHGPRMRDFLDAILAVVPVLPYDEEIVAAHVELLAWTHRHGSPRGQHDLVVAATAVATGRTLLTLDRKARFDELPGLQVDFAPAPPAITHRPPTP